MNRRANLKKKSIPSFEEKTTAGKEFCREKKMTIYKQQKIRKQILDKRRKKKNKVSFTHSRQLVQADCTDSQVAELYILLCLAQI